MRQRTNLYIICGMLSAVLVLALVPLLFDNQVYIYTLQFAGGLVLIPGKFLQLGKIYRAKKTGTLSFYNHLLLTFGIALMEIYGFYQYFHYGVDIAAFLITTTSGLVLEGMLLVLFVVYPPELEPTIETLHM